MVYIVIDRSSSLLSPQSFPWLYLTDMIYIPCPPIASLRLHYQKKNAPLSVWLYTLETLTPPPYTKVHHEWGNALRI